MASPSFRRGGQQAEEAAKQQNFSGNRNRYFTIKEDRGTAVLRLIDDEKDWIYTRQHSYVPTKGPDESMSEELKAKWPKRSGAVCRHDDAFKGVFGDCYICDHMRKEDGKPFAASIRLWARAVVRVPVIGTQDHVDMGLIKPHMISQPVGYDDSMVPDPEGNTEIPEVVVLNFSMRNFFGALQGYYDVNGTVLDRDFHITRKGTGTDTEYSIIARDPLRNEDGSIFDLRDPEIRAMYENIVDLEEIITSQASDDHYARYFDPSKPIPQRAKKDDDSDQQEPKTAAATPAGGNEPDPDQMAAMRARVKGLRVSAPTGN
jgi:hypothetical protein